jgi:CRP-like cAMP-binding protein
MCQPDVMEIFRGISFLEGLTHEELQTLAASAELRKYPAATVIFREGDTLPNLFLVVEGSIALEQRIPGQGAKMICSVGPGELLGWSPLLGQRPMSATARTLTSCWLVALEVEQALSLCRRDPSFGFTLMRQLAEALAYRLKATRRQLPDGCFHEPAFVASMHEGAD